jgi:PAS domain S-box-containing protein
MVWTRDEATARLTAYQERLEASLAGGLARYLAAFRDSPAGVGAHEIDSERRLTRVNPEELRMLGYREEALLGRPVTEFIVMQEASERAIEQKLKGARDLKPFLRTFRKADGSAAPMLLLDRLLKDNRGQVVGIRTAMAEVRIDA